MLRGLAVGILLGIVLVAAGVYAYFASGKAPVATSEPDMPFEHHLAHVALEAYLEKQPKVEPQVPADERNLLAAAQTYKQNCAVCHGLPGSERTIVANGMNPRPPQLFHGVGVTDDPIAETYWVIEGGIRMTGMPGFKGSLNETQIWQLAQLLKNADKIPPTVRAELTAPAATSTPSNAPAATPAEKK